MANHEPKRNAVIFDLDGTLTVPVLDFDAIRDEIRLSDGPILEAIERMEPDMRAAAMAVLERHEQHAAETAELQYGAAETISELRRRGYAVGILTRNARRWAELVLDRFGLVVDGLRAREDGVNKPAPDGVLALCGRFGACVESSWMVGDFLYDIQAGSRAGSRTVLMIGDGAPPDYASAADHVIRSLPRLLELVAPCDGP